MTKQKNPILAGILNIGFLIELAVLMVLIIARIWVKDNFLLKAILTDTVLCFGTVIFYFLLCYVPKEEEKNNKP